MPRRPILYEVHARCWLRDLSDQTGRPINLANVPSTEISRWANWGFTHVWLMGIWQTGPRARECYLNLPETRIHLAEVLPDWNESDVCGSAYAVEDYRVPADLGGNEGLEIFRRHLHEAGLRLILDFIPNHVGLDHPWVCERPELLVTSASRQPATFRQMTTAGERWIAHGRDPYFPPWCDTAQIDIRNAASRAELIRILARIADMCDGVRCDMAMLLLNSIFMRTWNNYEVGGEAPVEEFWREAIRTVTRPGFLFIAEAYWDLEEQLLELGFNYVYDKRILDWIVEPAPARLRAHLIEGGGTLTRRGVHFLENHDEARIASRLNLEDHRLGAMLCLGLPGLPMLHEGQMTGSRVRASVHLGRRLVEPTDQSVADLYGELLGAVRNSPAGSETAIGHLLTPSSLPDHERGTSIAVCWTDGGDDMAVIWVNPGRTTDRIDWELPKSVPAADRWDVLDALTAPARRVTQILSTGRRFEMEIPPRTGLFLILRPAN